MNEEVVQNHLNKIVDLFIQEVAKDIFMKRFPFFGETIKVNDNKWEI